jgi:hypothetical protein
LRDSLPGGKCHDASQHDSQPVRMSAGNNVATTKV